MWQMILPIMIIVISNTMYNICAKTTSSTVNPFASLFVTYSIAGLVSFVLFFVTNKGKNILHEFTKLNWASFVLGVVIIGLEFGYILAYRAGWQMNKVSVTANITLAIVLIFVAMVLYKEPITIKQIVGICMCAGGLLLMNL